MRISPRQFRGFEACGTRPCTDSLRAREVLHRIVLWYIRTVTANLYSEFYSARYMSTLVCCLHYTKSPGADNGRSNSPCHSLLPGKGMCVCVHGCGGLQVPLTKSRKVDNTRDGANRDITMSDATSCFAAATKSNRARKRSKFKSDLSINHSTVQPIRCRNPPSPQEIARGGREKREGKKWVVSC